MLESSLTEEERLIALEIFQYATTALRFRGFNEKLMMFKKK